MRTEDFVHCPRCATPLVDREDSGRSRRACPREGCGFLFYGNPLPVVGAIVELDGNVVLVRSKGWPEKLFGIVTGFLEAGETPEAAVLREVKEELGLDAQLVAWVGLHVFEPRNELIATWHVRAQGTIALGDELEQYKLIAPEKLRPWPFGTGVAVKQWLETRATRLSGS